MKKISTLRRIKLYLGRSTTYTILVAMFFRQRKENIMMMTMKRTTKVMLVVVEQDSIFLSKNKLVQLKVFRK